MIIWLASYPKSGNTWLRSILGSLLYTEDGIFDFKYLKKLKQFPGHMHLKEFIKDPNDIHEIKKFWIVSQEKLNLNGKINILKTHQGNFKIDQYPFTNNQNTLATIYIVRDPRNLVNSISNHFSISKEQSLRFITSPKFLKGKFENDGKTFSHIKVFLGNWGEHYKSWTTNNDSLLLVKYENLISNPLKELNKIITFLKKYMDINTNDLKNENILKSTSFENLRKMEIDGKFFENAHTKTEGREKIRFFQQGKDNQWQNNLDENIVKQVETTFLNEMKELGYL
tara:strand:+ start:1249 stop:2097 length:849 start_codon:yes stop_codon:yes gene_type:complete